MLKQASRVAFVVLGNEAAGADIADIIGMNNGADSPVYIWEPNANLHTDAAIAHASNTYGINVAEDGDDGVMTYYGISKAFDTQIALEDTMEVDENGIFALVEPDYVTTADENAAMVEEGIDTFTISKGITKVRMYMWIEGQDIDCEDSASGTSISYNVQLTVKSEEGA